MAGEHNAFANIIWQTADVLHGSFRPQQYERLWTMGRNRVMPPMTARCRFGYVLAPTKDKVVTDHENAKGGRLAGDAPFAKLNNFARERFHNHSLLDVAKLAVAHVAREMAKLDAVRAERNVARLKGRRAALMAYVGMAP